MTKALSSMFIGMSIAVLFFVQIGQAHDQSPPPQFSWPQIPGLPSIPGLPLPVGDIQKCWASLFNIEGCVSEILRSFAGQFGGLQIGPECCNAILTVSENCWAHMFPFTPFFPTLLKGVCFKAVVVDKDIALPPVAKN